MIVYKVDESGGFVVGDTATRHTAYAFPRSPNAQDAHRLAVRVACDMALSANAFAAVAPRQVVIEQDERNWARFREPSPNVVSLLADG
jgi:hypothetical protein